MAKEKPKTQETEEQTAIRKKIRNEWDSAEHRLIELIIISNFRFS